MKTAPSRTALVAEHRPVTDTEMAVMHMMGLALWRLARIWSAEKATLDRHMLRQASGDGPRQEAALPRQVLILSFEPKNRPKSARMNDFQLRAINI